MDRAERFVASRTRGCLWLDAEADLVQKPPRLRRGTFRLCALFLRCFRYERRIYRVEGVCTALALPLAFARLFGLSLFLAFV